MWILNICIFASASEIGVLVLYFRKLILRIQKKKKTVKHYKYFCLHYKSFMSSKESLPFLTIAPFLEKIFHPHPYCQIRGTQSPLFIKGGGGRER